MQNITIYFIYYFFTIGVCWHSTCCYSICYFCLYNTHNIYNFITWNHESISNTFYLTNTCARIPLIFFALTIIFTFTLTCFVIPFLIWITCCTIAFSCKFTITWNVYYQCFSLIFICYYIICLNIYIFHFNWSTYSHRLIITRITTSTTFI